MFVTINFVTINFVFIFVTINFVTINLILRLPSHKKLEKRVDRIKNYVYRSPAFGARVRVALPATAIKGHPLSAIVLLSPSSLAETSPHRGKPLESTAPRQRKKTRSMQKGTNVTELT